jgi:hypothetical protein
MMVVQSRQFIAQRFGVTEDGIALRRKTFSRESRGGAKVGRAAFRGRLG